MEEKEGTTPSKMGCLSYTLLQRVTLEATPKSTSQTLAEVAGGEPTVLPRHLFENRNRRVLARGPMSSIIRCLTQLR
jgi:hypothetical protein